MRLSIQRITKRHPVNESDVREFFYECIHNIKLGLGFHPDTPFEDYIIPYTDKPTFTTDESEAMNEHIDICFTVCENAKLDIYQIGFDLISTLMPKI